MPLAQFITGNRATALKRGEILSAIIVPKRAMDASSVFVKLGARRYLVISIVMAAVNHRARRRRARSSNARIAVGSSSAVAQRLPALEAALTGYARCQTDRRLAERRTISRPLAHRRCARHRRLS